MCINAVKETCFSQKYQKWIYQVLEMSSSVVNETMSVHPFDISLLAHERNHEWALC